MQYKIPVQIENEDPIFMGLSLRQLTIIMIGFGIAYAFFKKVAEKTGSPEVGTIPAVIICIITVLIATFKQYEMTFIPFILSVIRYNVNTKDRIWINTTDSFQPIDIGYLSYYDSEKTEKIDFTSKIDKIKELESKINKI